MDKIPCNVILDLLPLYADDVVSPESREMVETHLADCPACREALSEIRQAVPIPRQTDAHVLKKIRQKERLVLHIPVLILVLMLLLAIGEPALAVWRDSSIDYGPEDCIVSTDPDGRPVIEMSQRAKGANILYLYERNDDGSINVYIDISGNPKSFFSELLNRLLAWDFSEHGIYVTPTLGLHPPHAQTSYYPGTWKLYFDDTVAAVYYLPIDPEEQGEFMTQYLWKLDALGEAHLDNYQVPNIENRVLLWSEP